MKSNSAVTEKKRKEKKQKTYQQYIFYKVIVIILIAVLLAVTIFAIHAGSSGISVWDVIKTIFGAGTKQTNSIVFGIRLPRVVTALIAGMALGMVGCVMQSVLRNPLADASTLGVSQGAAFGATVAIICFGAGAQKYSFLLQMQLTSAILTWLLYVLLLGRCFYLIILGLSRFKKISPQSMILAGVALSALFSGGTTLIQYFADDVEVAAVVFWTFGDLGAQIGLKFLLLPVSVLQPVSTLCLTVGTTMRLKVEVKPRKAWA
ncbi:MAG: FecCD family ABC transporter permease [Acutalibacteraceae bacterium]